MKNLCYIKIIVALFSITITESTSPVHSLLQKEKGIKNVKQHSFGDTSFSDKKHYEQDLMNTENTYDMRIKRDLFSDTLYSSSIARKLLQNNIITNELNENENKKYNEKQGILSNLNKVMKKVFRKVIRKKRNIISDSHKHDEVFQVQENLEVIKKINKRELQNDNTNVHTDNMKNVGNFNGVKNDQEITTKTYNFENEPITFRTRRFSRLDSRANRKYLYWQTKTDEQGFGNQWNSYQQSLMQHQQQPGQMYGQENANQVTNQPWPTYNYYQQQPWSQQQQQQKQQQQILLLQQQQLQQQQLQQQEQQQQQQQQQQPSSPQGMPVMTGQQQNIPVGYQQGFPYQHFYPVNQFNQPMIPQIPFSNPAEFNQQMDYQNKHDPNGNWIALNNPNMNRQVPAMENPFYGQKDLSLLYQQQINQQKHQNDQNQQQPNRQVPSFQQEIPQYYGVVPELPTPNPQRQQFPSAYSGPFQLPLQ